MTDQYRCRVCGAVNCDNDCEELQSIYRERQREIAEELAGESPLEAK